MKYLKLFLFFFIPVLVMNAQDTVQTFLSLNSTGVEQFLQKYPEYDGRGTIALILDTGIDMGIDGLKKTSTGEVKVIDVQDFTGQGDIHYYKADLDEDNGQTYFVNEDHSYKVSGANKLGLKAVDDQYYIGLLPETLWKNSGSGAVDVNGNGKTDDKFYFIVFKTKQDNKISWVLYIDENDNGDLSDEKPLRNYKINYDTFKFPNKDGLPNFTIAVNIFPNKNLVSFFFDDGSHGTHCSGIATGYHIDGSPDFNGVAPGAKLMGLKLGNNNYAGGSTVTESMKKAYLYADSVSKTRKEPCIINMSFGIGSEIEGRADMEIFLSKLVEENPYLYISNSNGNEGPGISTTGLPAACDAILSTGAVLTKEVGRDLFDATLDNNIILHFSSRGGEVNKPNIVAPGACTSTVPNFSKHDRFWGTSMASPYSVGVMSLLLSAARVEYPDVKIPSRLLYKAIEEGATKMKGYDYVDQGSGYINVTNAWKVLKKYIKSNQISKFETYTVSSFAPNMPGNIGQSLYIRNGLFITKNQVYNFTVKRNNTINKHKFFRTYKLKSDSDWLLPLKRKTYIRNNQAIRLGVKIDKSKLKNPGLYNGMIHAYRADRSKFPEFDMMATVVIPYEFNEANKYTQGWDNIQLKPGELRRYFIQVPAGATSMKIKMSSDPKAYTYSWYFLHEPDGRQKDVAVLNSDNDDKDVVRYYSDLTPGVYELDVLGLFRANGLSTCNLSVEFSGVNMIDDNVLSNDHNSIKFVNEFNEMKRFSVSGKIIGYQKDYTIKLDGKDYYKIPFVLKKDEADKTFKVSISKEDFNKTTDFPMMIYDSTGKSVAIDGLSYNSKSISIRNSFGADSAKFSLVLRPAFANAPGNMTIFVKETTSLKNKEPFRVLHNNSPRVTFYPSVTEELNCFYKPLTNVPKDAKPYGKIYFKNSSNDKTELEIPVFFKF